MARDMKMEVGAVNLRIPSTKKRDYTALLSALKTAKRGVNVRGDTFLAISDFDPEKKTGLFAKYSEIDLAGDWFDTENFRTAKADDLTDLKVPVKLKPNLVYFRFMLDETTHVVAFETYADSAYVSYRAIERYFQVALGWPAIAGEFGAVESDVVMSHTEALKLLELPDLKEVHITIRRPNSDDMGDDLASVFEKRLAEQGGDEIQEILTAKGKHVLKPNDRTKALATVAAENGDLTVKSVVNGVKVPHTLESSPLLEVTKYSAERASQPIFAELAARIFRSVADARRRLRG